MSTEPLRRVLFPTPRKNDDGTSSRSIQRIRPKPELAPVNLESTPTTFKQLVENSPVPLAVAAAKAAMRAAESTQNGRPIITEMTRAAEEVVKNSDYNAIRPPHVSPRPVPSRRNNVPGRSSSALLPPIPSPSTRPAGALSTFRRMFMRQQQARSWSSTPIPNDDDLPEVCENDEQKDREDKKPPPSPVHVPRTRIPSFRQPNFVPSTSGKRVRKTVTVPEKQPTPRAKYDPLKRLFGSSSPLPIAITAETTETGEAGTTGDDDHVENEKQPMSSYKTIESNGKQPKKRPRAITRIETGTIVPKDELNESPATRTRSAKRSRRASKTSDADDANDAKPKKKRRMSEVLRLQKALETAVWTNSVAVEKQTEVIVISDCSPDRPRPDVSIKFENKTTDDKGTGGKSASMPVRRKISGSTEESKPKKTARNNGIRQKVITRERSDTKSRNFGKRTVNATKRKVSSVKKSVKKKPTARGKDGAVDGSLRDRTQNTNKKATRRKEDRLGRFEAVVTAGKRRTKENETAGKAAEASGAAHSIDTRIPLKKRHTPEKMKDISPAEVVTNISVPCVDANEDKMKRKSPHPKRLSVPAKNAEGRGTVCEKSKETSNAIATNSKTRNLSPGCSEPAHVGGLRKRGSYTKVFRSDKPRPQRTSLENRHSETTDSEATLSEAARP